MKKREVINFMMKLFWIFIIGSIFGYVVEMIVAFVQHGYFESRQGLLYGPFAQVYGIGAIVYYLIIPRIKDDSKYAKKVFVYSMIIGGIVEYLCSYIQEVAFGTISWDYSNLLFNIDGRTSLLHCIYWGVFGVFFIKCVHPLFQKIDQYIENINFRYITSIFVIFMVFNITLSFAASSRQKERIQNIQPDNSFDVLLDTYYPDYIMNQIYSNKIEIIQTAK